MNSNKKSYDRKKFLEEEMKKNLLRRKNQVKNIEKKQERKKYDFDV